MFRERSGKEVRQAMQVALSVVVYDEKEKLKSVRQRNEKDNVISVEEADKNIRNIKKSEKKLTESEEFMAGRDAAMLSRKFSNGYGWAVDSTTGKSSEKSDYMKFREDLLKSTFYKFNREPPSSTISNYNDAVINPEVAESIQEPREEKKVDKLLDKLMQYGRDAPQALVDEAIRAMDETLRRENYNPNECRQQQMLALKALTEERNSNDGYNR